MRKNLVKGTTLLLALILALGVMAVPASAQTTSGTAQGFGGEVKVTVTLEGGSITDCVIEGKSETEGIGSRAIAEMPKKIIEAGGEADAVAGATVTSNAILEALESALSGGADGANAFAAGSYTVNTYGLNAPMTVVVTMSEKGIESIEVPQEGETIGIGDIAIEQVSGRILEAQSLNVDAVAGATYTSNVLLRAVGEALRAAGGNPSMLENKAVEKAPVVYEKTSAQYVIIGGGAAGMASAIRAAELGLDVVLLEKMDLLGGTSVMGGVGTQAGGSKLQLAKADPYTADEFYEYLKQMGVGVAETVKTIAPVSKEYAHTLAYRSGEMMDWLSDDLGLPMQASADHSNAHSLTSTENGLFGEQLVRALKGRLAELGVEVRMGNRAVEIVMEGGKVAGVQVQCDGGEYVLNAPNVALCTGGYGGGEEALKKFAPSRLGYVGTGAKSSTGDGLIMADAVGAQLANVEAITYRTIANGVDNVGGAIGLHNAPNAGAIIVNKEGKRFVNEVGSGEAVVLGIQAQTDALGYVIMDQKAMDERFGVAALYIPGTYEQLFTKAESLAELAGKMGIDARALEETVEAYGEAVDKGLDEAFGRDKFLLSKLDQAPFYAASGKPSNHICAGGIVTDGQARVLDHQNAPIEGLYAAGETVNIGYHPLLSALVYGRVAAEEAALRVAG